MSDYRTDSEIGPGLSPGLGEAPKALPPKPTDDELLGAAFRTSNSLGSVINRLSRGSFTPQAGYNPVDDLKGWDDGEYFRNHGTVFMGSQSPQETQAIKAELDQGRKDRETLAAGGSNGTVAGLAIGLVDPTMFLPVGNAVRLARAATIGGEAANVGLSVGKMALMQSTAQEALLQASQPERTLSESAINVGANTILASLIGAGAYGLLAKDGLLEQGVSSLQSARVKLSEHNGTLEKAGPESVMSAAVKINDKIYTGTNHLEAMEKAAAELGTNVENIHTKVDDAKQSQLDAWVTSSGRFVDSKEAAALVNSPHEKLDSSDPEFLQQAAPREAASVGAAASDTRNLSPVPYGLDSVPGVGKMVSKFFPNLDVLTNGSVAAKRAVTELSEQPLLLKANEVGETATRFGGPAITRELSIMRDGLRAQTNDMMMEQWGQHLGQEGGPTFLQRETGKPGGGSNKMTFNDFDAAVYDALSTGDTHEIPEVATAAQWIRRNGLNPIKERAAASIEGFKETTSRPGETYAPRNWDKENISANWNDFVGTWTDHLEGEQRVKAQSQERIGVFHGALESHRSTIDKLESKIAKLETDADVIAARAEETTRINKAANQRSTKLRENNQDALPLKNAQGGAVFETLARNRGNLLADRASAKLSEIEKLQGHLADEIQSHDTMRAKIETEIAAWEGKSAKEAKAALKARTEAEKARETAKVAGTYKGKDERLTSADKAIDSAVKEILTSERALDRQELKSRAEEIASRAISTPEGRLPYDASTSGETTAASSDLRGHTAHREIDIPYEMAKPWLERSATKALKSYTHSVLPDTLIAERFNGDPTMMSVMKDIESSYAAKRAAVGDDPKKQIALKDAMDNDIRIVAGMRDRIRGTYAYDPNMRTLATLSQNALKINNIVSSHGMAIASLPDFAGTTFRLGFQNALRDAWLPFSRALFDNEAWAALKAQGKELEAFGIGIDTKTASRMHALSDIDENYRAASKFERALTWASDKSFIVNLLSPLTDLQKRMAANAVSHNVLRMSQAVAEGRATAKQIRDLAAGNITEAQAAKIYEQFTNNGGANVKGVLLPNLAGWTDKSARLAFQGAVARDVDIAVVTPGQEKPFFLSKPGLNVLGQYKAFSISATQRILIANLQRHDAASLQGAVLAVGMGMLAYRINTMAAGKPFAPDVPTLFKEGISRGGILGIFDDANTVAAKATGGKVDFHRLYGADKPLSKFVSKDAAAMFLGPTYGKLQNLMQITRGVSNPSQWNESDSHALRMGLLGTNYPFFPQAFDKVEQGFNNAFGIPMKAKPQ